MKNVFLYISTLLNALLIVAVFFKSSINDIVVEYFKDRLEVRKKKRDATNLVYSMAKRLRSTTFIILIEEARTVAGNTTHLHRRKDYLAEFEEYNSKIEAVELYLPTKAIEKYNHFRDLVKEYGSEISREGTTKQRLVEIGQNLEAQIDKLKTELSKGFK